MLGCEWVRDLQLPACMWLGVVWVVGYLNYSDSAESRGARWQGIQQLHPAEGGC
jgi:hypothetical protein